MTGRRDVSRWVMRLVLLIVLALVAGGVGIGSVSAASVDGDTVKPPRLVERPWRSLVLVTVARRVACTGFVVGPRKVVTAAHCMVRDAAGGDYRLRKTLPRSVRLDRAYTSIAGGSPFRSCRASRVWAHPRFVRRNAADQLYGSGAHDYAVITTAPGCSYPANAVMRLWPTQFDDGQLEIGQRVRTGGYPADPRFDGMNAFTLWRTDGRVQPIVRGDPRLLNVDAFVAQGMSGGPVWRSFGNDSPCGRAQCVVGIIVECEVNGRGLCQLGDSARLAVRITPEVKRSIGRR